MLTRSQGKVSERTVWVYWVSRDSKGGELSSRCSLWGDKPYRERNANGNVKWTGTSYLGEHDLDMVHGWFRVVPDDDRMLIVVEQYVSPKMKEYAEQNPYREPQSNA